MILSKAVEKNDERNVVANSKMSGQAQRVSDGATTVTRIETSLDLFADRSVLCGRNIDAAGPIKVIEYRLTGQNAVVNQLHQSDGSEPDDARRHRSEPEKASS